MPGRDGGALPFFPCMRAPLPTLLTALCAHLSTPPAIEPEEAVPPFLDFVSTLTMDRTGEFWAPLGPKGIGNAEEVLGKGLPTPLEVPW